MIVVYFIGVLCTVAAAADNNSTIIFYHGSSSDSYQLFEADNVLDNPNFIKSRSTVIYFHGHNEGSDANTVKAIVNAYITNDGYNILILVWRELAAEFYPFSVAGIDELGNEVAKVILKLMGRGYPISKMHLVGHSLGAQLVGYVGRHIKSLTNNSQILPRISGLDPAGPDFYFVTLRTEAISKSDALFVDVIHTDAGVYGALVSTGTIDFWPNGGHRPQPGCQADLCSHQRSVYLWAESVSNKNKTSFTSYNQRNRRIQVQMGNNCPVNAKPGTYLLVTNSQSPFSRG